MAVSALELRPRGAVAICDAALRVASRNAGLWAITLPGSALLTGALLNLADATQHRRPVLIPALLLTAAWFARGVCQGAACHFVDRTLLGTTEPTVWSSFREALRRAPSLIITVGYLAAINAIALALTLGLALLFFSSHFAGYAVAMQGKEHPLSLYTTCSRMLGAARGSAIGVRILFLLTLPLLILNLHIAANVLTYLGRKLLGLDLTFAQRFASLDNRVWVVTVIALGFALLEPARAAAAALLLVDGRVRQEGLDLLAAVEQLPPRRVKRAALPGREVAAVLALVLAVGFAPRAAWGKEAEPSPPPRVGRAGASGAELRQRFAAVARRCGMSGEVLGRQLDAVDEIAAIDHSSLTRLLEDVESFAIDDGNCETARARLRQSLPLIVQTRDELRARKDAPSAAGRAREILARPEFAVDPEKVVKPPPEKKPDDGEGWFARFLDWLKRFLEKLTPDSPEGNIHLPAGGALSANLLVVVVVAGVVLALAYLLLSSRRKTDITNEGLELTTAAAAELVADPQSALSRLPESWASLADELAARGEFREAVRSLYLALLSKLHRLGAIDYDPALSNWDYFRGFKGARAWLPPFRELTSRFDFAYYGHLDVDSTGYQSFRTLSQPLLTVDPALGGSGA